MIMCTKRDINLLKTGFRPVWIPFKRPLAHGHCLASDNDEHVDKKP